MLVSQIKRIAVVSGLAVAVGVAGFGASAPHADALMHTGPVRAKLPIVSAPTTYVPIKQAPITKKPVFKAQANAASVRQR